MSLNRSILRPKELQKRETHSRVRLNLDREKKQEKVSKLSFERWRDEEEGQQSRDVVSSSESGNER